MLRTIGVVISCACLALLHDTAPAAAQATAAPAGKMTLALSSLGTAERWLPWMESGREGWLTLDPIYESLVDIDIKTQQAAPELAARWAMEADGARWRFFLRSDVPFHDGEGKVTAEDVKFSYDAMVSDRAVSSNKASLRAIVERVEVIGPLEIVFHLKQADATFLGRLSHGNFGIASKTYVERVGEQVASSRPVGTGPYRLIEHRRQQSVTFEALATHWRETARFKTVVLRRVTDQSARLAMLRAGEIDLTEIPFKLKREAEAAGLSVFKVPGAAVYHVQLGGQLLPTRETFDPAVPWVGDPDDPASQERALKVRRALNLAIDRRAIIRAIFEGEGVPAVVPFQMPGSRFIPTDLEPYGYDPKEAKRLLAEAGYPNGFARDIEMLLMPWPGRAEMVDVGEAVAGFWERNLALKVRRRPIDYATFAPNIGTPRKMGWITWAQGYTPRAMPDPVVGMDTWVASFSRFNTVAESLAIDKLVLGIRGQVDDTKRIALYHDLARAHHHGWHAVTIAAVPALYAYNAKRIAAWPLPAGEAYIGAYQRAVPAK